MPDLAQPVLGPPTVFGRLTEKHCDWRVYFHDFPQSATLATLWDDVPTNFRFFNAFASDAAAGALPTYSFIEPQYFTDTALKLIPNDMHPPHNIAYGEQLVAQVYNAVRSGPRWKQTLLIITFDEHGGCYDHVVPPRRRRQMARRPMHRSTATAYAFPR